MSKTDRPLAEIKADIDAQIVLLLIRGLVDELSSELDLHYDRDRLRSMREDDTIQTLIDGARFLREHEMELPESFIHILLNVCEDLTDVYHSWNRYPEALGPYSRGSADQVLGASGIPLTRIFAPPREPMPRTPSRRVRSRSWPSSTRPAFRAPRR